ncbi:MAG: DUF177 domain-containing protein [Bacteroidales bacterium]|nr:DUF177 domain-containing protein [Bacteroidales bacterium]
MTPLNEYIVPIQGIKNGLHQFEFDVTNDFLLQFNYDELLDAHIHAHVNLLKNNRLFDLEIQITGNILSSCDRCTDDLNIPVDFIHHLVIKLDDEYTDDNDEDIIFMPTSSTEIDLSTYIYEAIVFSVPMKRVHDNDENGNSSCNEEMIRRLNEYTNQELPTDPRWDALKGLLN